MFKNLPQYLVNFARRFATGSYATVSASAASSSAEDTLTRDAFGFRQIIVAATSHGKLFSIDSSNGRVLWSRVLCQGWKDHNPRESSRGQRVTQKDLK